MSLVGPTKYVGSSDPLVYHYQINYILVITLWMNTNYYVVLVEEEIHKLLHIGFNRLVKKVEPNSWLKVLKLFPYISVVNTDIGPR